MTEELGFKSNYVLSLGEEISHKLLSIHEKITNDLNQIIPVVTEMTMLKR